HRAIRHPSRRTNELLRVESIPTPILKRIRRFDSLAAVLGLPRRSAKRVQAAAALSPPGDRIARCGFHARRHRRLLLRDARWRTDSRASRALAEADRFDSLEGSGRWIAAQGSVLLGHSPTGAFAEYQRELL